LPEVKKRRKRASGQGGVETKSSLGEKLPKQKEGADPQFQPKKKKAE